MAFKRSVFYFIFYSAVLYGVSVYAAVLTVTSGSGNPGNSVNLSLSVDAASAPDIVGASFTITYNQNYLMLTRISSDFFDSFTSQWAQLDPSPNPMPPGSVVVDGITHNQPLLSNTVAGVGTSIAAVRLQIGAGDTVLFTVTFAIDAAAPLGDYPIHIVPTVIDNAYAGYPSSGSSLAYLIGLDPDAGDLSQAFPAIEVIQVNAGVLTVIAQVVDSDHDGIDDGWEMDNFGNLETVGQYSDYDGDGYSDLFEYEHEGDIDPGGERLFDVKSKNDPHQACVNTEGIQGDCYVSIEALLVEYARDYPNQPIFIKLIDAQVCNTDNDLVLDQNRLYFLCGGFGDNLDEEAIGRSFIDGKLIINDGTTWVENLVIGAPDR